MSHVYLLLLALFLGINLPGLGQAHGPAASVPDNLKCFVLKGYDVLDITKGDLNRDTYLDAVMVLYKKGEEKTSDVMVHPKKRSLLLLLGQSDKTYKLIARNDNAVYYIDCGGQMGDPYTGITIKNGYFSVPVNSFF